MTSDSDGAKLRVCSRNLRGGVAPSPSLSKLKLAPFTGDSIQITVNGESLTVPASCTLAEFLLSKSLKLDHVVVERNCAALNKAEASNTVLENSDVLEIVRIVAGG